MTRCSLARGLIVSATAMPASAWPAAAPPVAALPPAAVSTAGTPPTANVEALPDTIEIRSLLAVPRIGRGRRTPVVVDPIEARIVEGRWQAPAEDDTISSANGDVERWTRFEADEEGYIQDESLVGGYAYAEVDAPGAGVYLLEAAGHRHVYVNGEARIGDVYHRGFLRIPVRIAAGRNTLLFKEGWGAIRARLVIPPAPVFLDDRDDTLPSVVAGDEDPWVVAGLVVTNATETWLHDVQVRTGEDARGPASTTSDEHRDAGGDTSIGSAVGSLPPLFSRKVAVRIPVPVELRTPSARAAAIAGDSLAVPDSLAVRVDLVRGDRVLDARTLRLDVTAPTEKHTRAFVSTIDGSVQHYGVTPPPSEPDRAVGLVLTLHGAGVPARQAHHYRQRDWAYIVAPTNRREFGFDWEDWGRLDALEVLADAESRFAIDPRRRWLTGHSMGGHGTWNLGAHFPDLFGAIAPSAGWPDFWRYGAADSTLFSDGPMDEILSRSVNASRTLLLEENLRHVGVYVLHGDEDETVPVALARLMRERLARFHTNWVYYERPGVGHWWGANSDCMDWPPLMEFLERNPIPEPASVREISFTTISPGISPRCFWVRVEGQLRAMSPSVVHAEIVPESLRVVIETENVARLSLDLTSFSDTLLARTAERPFRAIVDAETLDVVLDERSTGDRAGGADVVSRSLRLARAAHGWAVAVGDEATDAARRTPERTGPFKAAFRNRMIFVVATGGDARENALVLSSARYDAETFYYRGNGAAEVVLDRDFDPSAHPNRNVILYGNADTHEDWAALLADCPVTPRSGAVDVGDRRLMGEDLACLFVYPRAGSDVASVGVVSGTGGPGVRVSMQLPTFTSGVGYPDWVVIGADAARRGIAGIRAAGFFDDRWALGEDSAFR